MFEYNGINVTFIPLQFLRRKQDNTMKIANKISLSFFVTTFILMILALSIVYRVEKENLKTAIFNHLKTIVQSRKHHIETVLKNYEEIVLMIATGNIFKDVLDMAKSHTQKIEQVNRRIKNILQSHADISSVRILDKNGIIIASSHKDVGFDKSIEEIFLKGRKGVYIKDMHISKFTGNIVLTIAAPIFLNGEFAGVTVINFDGKELFEVTTNKTGLGKTGDIYIVNRNGYMITPSSFRKDTFLKLRVDDENTRKAFEDIEKFGQKGHKHNPFVYTDYRGVRVLGTHDHIFSVQWVITAAIDEKEVLAPLRKVKFLLIFNIIVIPILAWLIGIFISGILSRPIHNLRKGVEIIGFGNLDYKVGTEAKDEIGQLSLAFDKMTEKLKSSLVSKDYMENIVNSMADILVVVTPDGIIEKANRAALDVLGYNTEELIGKDLSFLFAEKEDEDGIFKKFNVEKVIIGSALKNYEVNLKTKDSIKIPVLLSSARIKAVDCLYGDLTQNCQRYRKREKHQEKILSIVCVAKDITEQKRAREKLDYILKEEIKSREIMVSMLDDNNQIREKVEKNLAELKETKDMLVQSEKLALLGRLVSDMAHEVNNPLMIISGNAQLSLMEDLKNQPQLKESFEVIKEECVRAKNIIRRLLTFSKPSKGEFKEVDINEALDLVVKLVEHQYLLVDVKVRKNYTAVLPKVKIDEEQMYEVFMNLLKNSAESMPKGGTISVSTSKENDNIRIDFKDTGSGISEKNIKKIFDPFFTTKESGTGLGLSVCYGIINAHNGEMRYESKSGEGTNAIILLPIGK